ncbi:MAG: class I SAM-dependent methyltransferase [Thermoproteota archaeon]
MLKFLGKIVSETREAAFSQSYRAKIISKVFSIYPIGKLAFRLSMMIKKLLLLEGLWTQREVEYPWVLNTLRNYAKPGSIVLDLGCSESLLSHELVSMRFRVIGLDIRDYPFKSKYVTLVKKNVIETGLPSDFFDAIIVVSTIEHIGLNAYGQITIDDQGDIRAMKELHRILKPGGIIIITLPYTGRILKIGSSERNYNRQRLDELLNSYHIVKESYFFPKRVKKRIFWIEIDRKNIDHQNFTEPGLACIVAKKS